MCVFVWDGHRTVSCQDFINRNFWKARAVVQNFGDLWQVLGVCLELSIEECGNDLDSDVVWLSWRPHFSSTFEFASVKKYRPTGRFELRTNSWLSDSDSELSILRYLTISCASLNWFRLTVWLSYQNASKSWTILLTLWYHESWYSFFFIKAKGLLIYSIVIWLTVPSYDIRNRHKISGYYLPNNHGLLPR